MLSKTEALHEGLKKMLNYLPMIYNQQNYNKNGEIIIKYPYEKIPENAILFVLPLYNSTETYNYLTIKYAKVESDGSITYTSGTPLKILVEGTDGKKREATTGDIIANRLCMFRFMTNNSKEVILINNPIYNNLKCSSLYITNEARFCTIPEYIVNAGEANEYSEKLALDSELQQLKARVLKLENMIKVGTESADEYFANNKVADGTLYLQVEE